MELTQAKFIADGVVAHLAPYCERIAIAGSVRRLKPEPRDIEVVCIPKRVIDYDMFDKPIGSKNHPMFQQAVNLWEKVKGVPDGKYTQRILPEGIKLDLFMATKENFGWLMVIRTGSDDFSKKIASRWVKFGYHGVNGMLNDGRRDVPIYEEMDLFKLLGMEYIEPQNRR